MELFRITLTVFAGALTSSRAENRWNMQGESVLYAGSSRSLSTLEKVVHRASLKPTNKYKVLVISVSDDEKLVTQLRIQDLPANWRTIAGYPTLQQMGSDWYKKKQSLLLKVPSAVVIQEYNYVINTTHPEFLRKVSLVRTEDYFWDPRLY